MPISMAVKHHKQKGYAIVAVFALVFAAITALFTGWSSNAARQVTNRELRDQQAYLKLVAEKIEMAYQADLAVLDVNVALPGTLANPLPIPANSQFLPVQPDAVAGVVVPGTGLLARLGLEKYNARIAVSNRFFATGSVVPGRVIAVWIPVSRPNLAGVVVPDASVLNVADGVFTPSFPTTPFVLIQTDKLHLAAYYQTKTRLGKVTTALQSYFRSRFELSGLKLSNFNYFRPTVCTAPLTANDMPCVDGFQALNVRTDVLALAGLNAQDVLDGWGAPILVTNQAPAASEVPPFSMALQAVPPWSASILVNPPVITKIVDAP